MTINSDNEDNVTAIWLSFDFEQRSSQLCWDARGEGKQRSYKHMGRAAGSVWLRAGNTVNLIVTGGGISPNPDAPWSFDIVECLLITYPEMSELSDGTAATFAQTSPFVSPDKDQPASVVRSIKVSSLEGVPANGEYTFIRYRGNKVLQIIPPIVGIPEAISVGRWSMTFVVTVRIRPVAGGDSHLRVFRFDPETEVGNGVTGNQSL